MRSSTRNPKFYIGQRIVIDDFVIDRKSTKPDAFMPIPDLPKFGIYAEKVPLRRIATFTGYINDCKEKFVNEVFSEYCYRIYLDAKQKDITLPIPQRYFWTTEDSYGRRIRKHNF
ncbi:hypothetical protein J4437_02770 [Candidatus Woesearchaeota archaeon]|nr:hypothetical protein [Candidatus Woesearchaeota archaeon]